MINLDNVILNDVEFGIYRDGPVGISVSCGADSAIILYLLMKEVKHDLHIYNVIGDRRQSVLEPAVDRVIAKCVELTGKTNYFIHKTYSPRPPGELVFQVYKESLDKGEVDIVYTGLTKFPPDDVHANWEINWPEWHLQFRRYDAVNPLFGVEIKIPEGTDCSEPPLTIDGKYKDKISQDARVYNPMINHTKQSIASLYRALGVEETLFPHTRSCEDDNHTNGHCGKCWWCKERLWGFGHLE